MRKILVLEYLKYSILNMKIAILTFYNITLRVNSTTSNSILANVRSIFPTVK